MFNFNNDIINESNLLQFDNQEDNIAFSKSSNTLQDCMKKYIPNILKNNDKQIFTKQLLGYLYKDKSINGFKFDNKIFNENPAFVKFSKNSYIEGSLKDNLLQNGWKPLFDYGDNIQNYLCYKYNSNYSDKEIIENKYTHVNSYEEIQKIKNLSNYNKSEQIFNLIYNDYLISFDITHRQSDVYSLYLNEIYISEDNVFFIASIQNLRGTNITSDYDLVGINHVGKDMLLIGYTGIRMPEQNDQLSIDLRQVASFKKVLSNIFSFTDENGNLTEKITIPNEFHPEIIEGHLALVYTFKYNDYVGYEWEDIFKRVQFENKKLNRFIKYIIDYRTWYINDNDLRNKFKLDENKPILIKAPFDPKCLCMLYCIYDERKYLKLIILDNTNYKIKSKRDLIYNSVSSSKWYGFKD